MVKTVVLAFFLTVSFCPDRAIKAIGHGIHNAFYAVTNFYVNHIQPNQKGDPGKVVYIYNGTVGPTQSYGPEVVPK